MEQSKATSSTDQNEEIDASKRYLFFKPMTVNHEGFIPSALSDLFKLTEEGLSKWNDPQMSAEGTSGVYLMLDASGTTNVSVFKPTDEEPGAVNNPKHYAVEGLRKGITVGGGAFREVAAYLLDHPIGERRWSLAGKRQGFSGVPLTFMATFFHKGFNHPDDVIKEKTGSLQMFMKNDGSCNGYGYSIFPVEEVHKIAVLDIRLANTDRHEGNILMRKDKDGKVVLIPIDHGYSLPTSFEECAFQWIYWPQARKPFSPKTIDYIKSLDVDKDIDLLKLSGWRNLPSECARTFRISAMLLKKGVEKGLTASAIGKMMCREDKEKQSFIEEIIQEVEDAMPPGVSETEFLEAVEKS